MKTLSFWPTTPSASRIYAPLNQLATSEKASHFPENGISPIAQKTFETAAQTPLGVATPCGLESHFLATVWLRRPRGHRRSRLAPLPRVSLQGSRRARQPSSPIGHAWRQLRP